MILVIGLISIITLAPIFSTAIPAVRKRYSEKTPIKIAFVRICISVISLFPFIPIVLLTCFLVGLGHGSTCEPQTESVINFYKEYSIFLLLWSTGIIDYGIDKNAKSRSKNIYYSWIALLMLGITFLIYLDASH